MIRRTAGLRAATVILVMAASATGCSSGDSSSGGPAATPVSLGYIADYSGSAAFAVAAKQGLWAKQGLKPDLKVFTNGPLQVQALGAGDLDFGYVGPGALWLPASGKAKIIAVNMLGQADRVIARPGSGTTKAADLKGKKVAVPDGTSGDMILNLALEQAGLKPGDITRVSMDPSTVVAAFSSGQVDAAALWYPLIDTIKKRVPDLVEVTRTQDFYPKLTFPSAFVTQPGLPASNPALVKKVTTVLREADDWIAAHPQDSEKVTADFLKLPADQLAGSTKYVKIMSSGDLAKLTEDGTADGWFNGLADVFVTMGKLKAPGDAKDYYLGSQYQAATAK
ncbi:aliphatic sulfonate ABC transporter substrate-binding protein [Streptomyces sp. NPDC056231]|uniref:aliphatic sulfonate ABC transporter substrate-binding protein n=1 Tax=Streptomyces sp. NPDC056231 TaxID=3345755 RepID=UPI003AAAE63E